jgi:transposase-like protein
MKKETGRKRRPKISQEEKMEIVKTHYLEGVSHTELARRYGTVQTVVSRIIRTFAAENDKSAMLMGKRTTDSLSEDNKALRKEILDLKKQLYHEKMRADFYDTMVDVAEEMFGIEIRKKAVTGQSKGCTKGSQDIQ